MATKTKTGDATNAVETVQAVDEALANGMVEEENLEKQAAILKLLRDAQDGGRPEVEQRPLPRDVMNDSPLVQDAKLAVERATEHLAALEQERINIANAQIDAGAMAANPSQFGLCLTNV